MNKYKILFCLVAFLLMVCIFSHVVYGTETAYVWANQSSKLETTSTSINPITNSDTITDNSLNLECGSACLMEQSTRPYYLRP